MMPGSRRALSRRLTFRVSESDHFPPPRVPGNLARENGMQYGILKRIHTKRLSGETEAPRELDGRGYQRRAPAILGGWRDAVGEMRGPEALGRACASPGGVST